MAAKRKRITEMFAFVTDEAGDEGILGFLGPNNMWYPMVGADMERVSELEVIAQNISNARGIQVRIITFSTVRVTKTLTPQAKEPDGTRTH